MHLSVCIGMAGMLSARQLAPNLVLGASPRRNAGLAYSCIAARALYRRLQQSYGTSHNHLHSPCRRPVVQERVTASMSCACKLCCIACQAAVQPMSDHGCKPRDHLLLPLWAGGKKHGSPAQAHCCGHLHGHVTPAFSMSRWTGVARLVHAAARALSPCG